MTKDLNIFYISEPTNSNTPERFIYLYNNLRIKSNVCLISSKNDIFNYKNIQPHLIYIASYVNPDALQILKRKYPDIIFIYEKTQYYELLDKQHKEFNRLAEKYSKYIICGNKYLIPSCNNKEITLIEDPLDLFTSEQDLNNHSKPGILYINSKYDNCLDYNFINNITLVNTNISFYFYLESKYTFKIKKRPNVFFLTPISGPFDKIREMSKYKYGWLPLRNTPYYYDYQYPSLVYSQAQVCLYIRNLPVLNENMTNNFNNLLKMNYNRIMLRSLLDYVSEIESYIDSIVEIENIKY